MFFLQSLQICTSVPLWFLHLSHKKCNKKDSNNTFLPQRRQNPLLALLMREAYFINCVQQTRLMYSAKFITSKTPIFVLLGYV